MNLVFRINTNIISIIVSIIFLINILGRLDKKDLKSRTFMYIFILNTLQLIFETLTCVINKQPYFWLIPITYLLHIFLYIGGPLVTYLWYLFASLWIRNNLEGMFKKSIFMLLPLILNSIIVLLTPFFKLAFYIDIFNVYHRGPLFIFSLSVSYFYLLCGFILIYLNRKTINRLEFLPLLLFGVLPILGGLFQALFYGLLLMWSTISFSLIILYLYLQQQMMHIDYLTGACTREKFHNHLVERFNQKNPKCFSIVFIDLDDFKKINDTLGHNEGDKVLANVTLLIKNILTGEDFITRYGGDEFILFLNVDSDNEVQSIMKKIFDALTKYNKTTEAPYDLCFSYGYEIYNPNKHIDADEYIDYVDKLMYENKKKKKTKKENTG